MAAELIIAVSVASKSAAATYAVAHQWWWQHWLITSGRQPLAAAMAESVAGISSGSIKQLQLLL